jgi:catechol 2,3-dioxygenase
MAGTFRLPSEADGNRQKQFPRTFNAWGDDLAFRNEKETMNKKTISTTDEDEAIRPIHPGVHLGHVHLRVSNLDRSLAFYQNILGFNLTQRYGESAAFLSAGGYHHHIGLNTWESLGGSPPPKGTTGLYHLAILYPTRAELGDALDRLVQAGWLIEGASDHGVSEAIYISDPDGNGVELYWDRPEAEWPRDAEGNIAMFTRPLNLQALLLATDGKAPE